MSPNRIDLGLPPECEWPTNRHITRYAKHVKHNRLEKNESEVVTKHRFLSMTQTLHLVHCKNSKAIYYLWSI